MNSMGNAVPTPLPDTVTPTGNPTGVSGVNDAANEYLGRQMPPKEPAGCAGGTDAAGTGAAAKNMALKPDPTVMD